MEQDFAERLKKYRREKNLTQQDLADRVGVSNKTVSRWESGGGYPDVPLLVPLAHALGVGVDDLLDGEKPIRSLTRADWQSLLSFAFALGGGVLFFLLDLFMPALVCYLGYLGCMAYGVYLQKYYAYRSRWFLLGNLVMNFAVNLSLCASLSLLAGVSMSYFFTSWLNAFIDNFSFELIKTILLLCAAVLVPAVLLTAATQYQVWKRGFRGAVMTGPSLQYRLVLERPKIRRLIPAAVPLLACGFWLIYRLATPVPEESFTSFKRIDLPLWAFQRQEQLFLICLAVLAVLAVLPLLRRGDRRWILPAWALTALCWPMTGLRVYEAAWSPVSGQLIPYTDHLGDIYEPLGQWSPGMLALGLVLSALWVLVQCIHPRRKEPEG